MEVIIKKSTDSKSAYAIAQKLPDYFDANGLKDIERDTKNHVLYGAFSDDKMIGFVTYNEVSSDVVEMSWLGVLPERQGNGVGEKLVDESLKDMAFKYKACKVKTLSETDPYEPYKNTRDFYKRMGFISIETIQPYPGWGENPCQIFVRFLCVN